MAAQRGLLRRLEGRGLHHGDGLADWDGGAVGAVRLRHHADGHATRHAVRRRRLDGPQRIVLREELTRGSGRVGAAVGLRVALRLRGRLEGGLGHPREQLAVPLDVCEYLARREVVIGDTDIETAHAARVRRVLPAKGADGGLEEGREPAFSDGVAQDPLADLLSQVERLPHIKDH